MAAPAPAPASRCCALAASAWHAHLVSEAGGQEHTNGLVPVLSCCQSSHCTPWRACCHAIFSPSSNAASRKRLQCAGCWRWRASSAGHGKIAAFPQLWSVVGLNEGFVVQDAGGQPLAYVYFEDETAVANVDAVVSLSISMLSPGSRLLSCRPTISRSIIALLDTKGLIHSSRNKLQQLRHVRRPCAWPCRARFTHCA